MSQSPDIAIFLADCEPQPGTLFPPFAEEFIVLGCLTEDEVVDTYGREEVNRHKSSFPSGKYWVRCERICQDSICLTKTKYA